MTAPDDLHFYSAGGVVVPRGQPLVALTTYYVDLGGDHDVWSSVQWKYDAAIVLTSITYESTNLANVISGERADFWGGISTYAAAAGGWSAESTFTTVTVAGGTAGNVLVHVGGNCARRLRGVVVVGAAGGNLRAVPYYKGGRF